MTDPVVDAMQEALAGQHAAVYAYEVIGGRLDYGTRYQQLADDRFTAHRELRDQLVSFLTDAGAEPVGAEPAYELPVEITSESDAKRVGRQVEDRCSVLHAAVVAVATGRVRTFGVDALSDTAVAVLEWGARSSALPGVAKP